MIDDVLRFIGLTDKETKLYVALLRHGMQPTSYLARRAGLNRGTAFLLLHALVEKGLASKSTKGKIQHFAPLEPKELLHYLDRRERDIETQKQRVQGAMGQLYAIMNPLTSKPKIQFFDGREGARTVLDHTLTSSEKTLCAFLSIADVIECVGMDFFSEYTDRRVAAGFTLHAIRTREKDKEAMKKDAQARRYVSSRKEHRVVRHVPEDLAFPITMYMYDGTLAIISSAQESFAMLIESRELAEMQKKLFSLLWRTAAR